MQAKQLETIQLSLRPMVEQFDLQVPIVQQVLLVQILVLLEPTDLQLEDKLYQIDKHVMQENIVLHLVVLQLLETARQDIIVQLEAQLRIA